MSSDDTAPGCVDYDPTSPLPHRISGQLEIPPPVTPLWFQDDPVLLERVRDGIERIPSAPTKGTFGQ
jgi:hypothetical protein